MRFRLPMMGIVCFLCTYLLFPWAALSESTLASAPLTAGSAQNGMVRVRLSSLGNPSTLNLTIYGSYTLSGQSGVALGGGEKATVRFNSSSGALSLTAQGKTYSLGSSFRLCRHESAGQSGVKIAQGRESGNLYPGDFEFVSRKNGASYTLYVIAHIYMEDYLYGVLPYEMGDSSGLEALKAQAVAARTYTLRAMQNAASASLYDVVDTTADQVYSGTPTNAPNCQKAVDATRGIVVKNGDAFTATYYTASNGGQTESVKNAWGVSGPAYLTVKDDPYDLANPDSRVNTFTISLSGSQKNAAFSSLISKKAAAAFGSGATVTEVTNVTLHTPKFASPSRLYTKMDVAVRYTKDGLMGSGILSFNIFSELEGPLSMSINAGSNELWSVTRTDTGFTVAARRYGHGIGMSQRGAMYMAKIGYTYDQILAFYYEGCARVRYTLNRSILSPVVPGQDSVEQVIPEEPAPMESTPAPSLPDNIEWAYVATASGSLNLRAKPSDTAKVLLTIPQGEKIPILEKGSAWCQTQYGGQTGYVMRSFLSFPGDAPAATPAPSEPTAQYAQVTTAQGSLNLRKSPQANAPVLRAIPQYQVILLTQVGDTWCQTTYEGDTGYVMAQYLTLLSSPAEAYVPSFVPETSLSPTLTATVQTPSGSLNLRKSPSASAPVLTAIPQYDPVIVKEKGTEWCYVEYIGKMGYVMTKFLSFEEETNEQGGALRPLATPVLGQVASTASTLNLREACSTSSRVLLEIPRLEYVTITAVGDTWCAVSYGGETGYCMTRYLEFELYE